MTEGMQTQVTPVTPGAVPHELSSALLETLPQPDAVLKVHGARQVVVYWREDGRWQCECSAAGTTVRAATEHLMDHWSRWRWMLVRAGAWARHMRKRWRP